MIISKLINEKAFKKMNKFRKRVAIAKDVLARIAAQNIKPEWGVIARTETFNSIGGSLQKRLNESKGCQVCAKGALCISWIGNFNKYEYFNFRENLREGDKYPAELIKIFGKRLLDGIEVAFEGNHYFWDYEITQQEAEKIISVFGQKTYYNWCDSDKKFKESIKRMVAVFENIVKNKGKLVCGNLVIE